MKIGILTFWWSQDNYGQLLQCYALQKYLRDLGHDVFLIRYNFEKDIRKNSYIIRLLKALNIFYLFSFLKKKIRKITVNKEQKLNTRFFDAFRDKYIIKSERDYSTFCDLQNNPPEADVYIVGSDQVWNYWDISLKRFINPLHAYFLDFGDKQIKRLSYAASWGVKEIPLEYQAEITPLLKNFNYVSVREESGKYLCNLCARPDAEWVCDPTLLIDAETYRNLYKSEVSLNKKGYILLYMLSNKCDFNINSVFTYAKERGLDVVYITGNGVIDKYKKYYATIPEWLYFVDNAQYVITNSFHCGVFSIIFHKQFCIVPLVGEASRVNSRFESLFSFCKIENRYLNNYDFSILGKEYDSPIIEISKQFKEMVEP